jgi:hypothetical protein
MGMRFGARAKALYRGYAQTNSNEVREGAERACRPGYGRIERAASSMTGHFATLLDMVNHYDVQFNLNLRDANKRELIEY